MGAAAAATYVAARARAPRPSTLGAGPETRAPTPDAASPAESTTGPAVPPDLGPPQTATPRPEAPTGAVTIVPVAMEATSALEPRGPDRNGSPVVAVSGDGTTAVRPRAFGPVELPAPKRPGAATLAGLAAVAALAAIALGFGGIVLGIAQGDDEDAASTAEARRAVALLSKPSTERVPLAGSEGRVLLAVGSASRGFLVLRGLLPAPSGRAYEAWVVERPDAPRPAALFSGDERLVPLSRPVPAGATVGVSLESEAGSDAPTERFRFVARRPAP